MVQYRGDIGLDMVVMKGEREEKERRKERRTGRFALKAKPNPSTHTITTHHDTISPLPRTKAEIAGEKRKEESDGLGER